jgi:hypothetical protein
MYYECISVPLELGWTITNRLETTDSPTLQKEQNVSFFYSILFKTDVGYWNQKR